MDSTLLTTIGLEIHVQLKTKSKMFCRCDNNAEDKAPNTVVCPVCLGLPGALPVTNEQAVLMTIKTGLALNSDIPKIAKFDRKHYFYPDLPKGYQISQYDEPFAIGGSLNIKYQISNIKDKEKDFTIRFNRVHLEEDAGKLIHANGKSLVDLNRAGTPLMEMVTEPDITSPKQAGDFLRRLQKLVRDEVKVSDADMEKGHLRCDANISVSVGKVESGEWRAERMSEIVEIKNLNSFRFVEKALALEEGRLKAEYPNWPERKSRVTRGYDSKKNITYVQRTKEEAADYRYFPEPDLPPFDMTKYDIEALRSEIGESPESKSAGLLALGLPAADARILVDNKNKGEFFKRLSAEIDTKYISLLARAVVHNYFSFIFSGQDYNKIADYIKAIKALSADKISKANFTQIAGLIHEGKSFEDALNSIGGGQMGDTSELDSVVEQIVSANPNEVAAYKAGKAQLLGFFVGLVMKKTGGKANPKVVNEILRNKLTNS